MKRAPGSYEGLTPRQADLLSFIREYTARTNGVAPTFREMVDGVGLASFSTVTMLLDGLERRGYIERRKHLSRAMRVFDGPVSRSADASSLRTDDLVAELKRRGFRFAGAYA